MLNDLKIKNGNLELKFDKYTYEYTVIVENNVNSLEFDYELEKDSYINIRNNILNNEESIVYIDVYNLDSEYTYTFYVYKENINEVSSLDSYVQSLEVSNIEEVVLYKVQILTVSLFLTIIIIFSIIFKRKKIQKNNQI